jgi:hypothetical protein
MTTTTSTSLDAVGRHGGASGDDDVGDVDAVGSSSSGDDEEKMRGRAMLLLVALLYGTLNVSLRGIYATEGPPVASVLSLVRQCLSLVAFVPIFFLASSSSSPSSSSSSSTADGPEEDAGRPLMIGGDGDYVDGGGDAVRKQKGGAGGGIVVRPMWMSALELAFWNFGAQVREERRVGRAGCRRPSVVQTARCNRG